MKRILVKLSGEGLSNKKEGLSIDPTIASKIVEQIKELVNRGIQVGIVVGGGNFWRGKSATENGIERNRADYIGMLATIMNGLALQSCFENAGVKCRIQSSLSVDSKVAETYVNEKAISYLEKNEVVIFSGGTGRPYFTTDTAATLVATEISAEYIFMGKNGIDGIYDSDPRTNKDAKRFDTLKWDEVISRNLQVMDLTAAAIARENDIKLVVFNVNEKKGIVRAVDGDITSTKVVK